MKKFILVAALLLVAFGGCTAKEFNEGADSITSDVSKAFNDSKDTSAE